MLHTPVGEMPGRVALPELPGAEQWTPPLVDRVGESVRETGRLVAAGAGVAGLVGVAVARRSGARPMAQVLTGLGAAITGAAMITAGAVLGRGTDEHRAPVPPRGASAPSTRIVEREQVKAMTFNVHGGMGGLDELLASSEDLDRVAAVIRRERPDVVMLQEVDESAPRSNWTDTLAELSRRLGPDSAVGASATTSPTGRYQQVAIMTFNGFSIEDARNIVHPDPDGGGIGERLGAMVGDGRTAAATLLGRTPPADIARYSVRNTLDAMVLTPQGNHLRVLSGHYERQRPEADFQQRQAGDLAPALGAWGGATILGADFNVGSDNRRGARERRLLGAAGLHDSFLSAGIKPSDPARSSAPSGAMIDRIYHTEHARTRDAYVVRDDWSSDHRAVVSTLELIPASG